MTISQQQPAGADAQPEISTSARKPLSGRAAANIREMAATIGGPEAESVADALIARGATVDEARAAVIDELAARSAHHNIRSHVLVGTDWNAPEARIDIMAEAISARLQGRAPAEAARQYANAGLLDMAAELLQLRGERVPRWSRTAILERAHGTSDFPALLTSTGNRLLQAAYQAAPSGLKAIARENLVNDFRPLSKLKLSAAPALLKVNEGGEVKHGTMAEAKESFRVESFARIFTLSRQAIVNDDLGAFADWTQKMASAAAAVEAEQLVGVLSVNSWAGVPMDDGKALFHTDHGNLAGAGGTISVETLSAARLAMRQQTDIDGKTLIAVTPRYLVVGPAKETEGEQVLASIAAAQVAAVNPFAGKLELVVEPRITGNNWYLFADPASLPCLEYAYLADAPGPQFATRPGFDVLGMEMRVSLDFGAGAVEWRSAYRNPGA